MDSQKGGLGVIQDSVLRQFLFNHNFIELERAIPNFSPGETLTTLEDGSVVKVPDFSLVYLFHFPDTTSILALCDTFRTISCVEWVNPNLLLFTYSNPNDPRFSEQWSLARINAPGAWNYEKGSSNVRIGIVDGGIKHDHPDLGAGFGSGFKIAGGYDFGEDDNDPYDYSGDPHGTHVAGIASALTHNGIGIAGMSGGWGSANKGCLLYNCKVASAIGILSSDVAEAIIMAAKPVAQGGYGCRVINLSLGAPFDPNPQHYYPYISEEIREAIIYAYKCQRNVIAAKGNAGYFGGLYWTPPFWNFPSDFEPHLVISVGATGEDDHRCLWSNYSNNIDVVAPGSNILSTYMPSGNNMYYEKSGTSMAAPHVSGLAGLIWSEAQELGMPMMPELV